MTKHIVGTSIIGRGRCGWHSDGIYDEEGNTVSSSGGTLEKYVAEARDGTPVYDASDADLNSFAKLVISGPILKVDLEPGTIQKFGDKKAMLGMLPALEGGFKTLAVMCLSDLASMDYIATDVYLTMLREQVSGVRFGTVQGGKVVWET
jgi:hypothetical protein